MPKRHAPARLAACIAASWAGVATAHAGHGLSGAHWHATDAWGFAIAGVQAAMAIWWSRRGK